MVQKNIPLPDADPRVQVVNILRGQTIRVPDLHEVVFTGAFRGLHPEIEKVRDMFEAYIEK
jgi:hypothetical protein